MRTCKWCGKQFDAGYYPSGKPRRTKLCLNCQLKIITPKSKPCICSGCGNEYVPNKKRGKGKRRYCDECLQKAEAERLEREKQAAKAGMAFRTRQKEQRIYKVRTFSIEKETESIRSFGKMLAAWAEEAFKAAKSIEEAIKKAEAMGFYVIERYELPFDTDTDGRRYFKCSSCYSWKRFKDSNHDEKGNLICAACLEDKKAILA